MRVRFTTHALDAMTRRGLSVAQVERAVREPGEILPDGALRSIRQKVEIELGQPWLIRVVVEPEGDGFVVVTAYRTSKLSKYGAGP